MNAKIQKMTPEKISLLSEPYQQYHLKIYSYVYSILKDKYTANDIVSEAFTPACEKLGQLKGHLNRGGWLYVTAQNKIKELYRKLPKGEILLGSSLETEHSGLHSPYSLKDLEITLQAALSPDEHKRFLRCFAWGYTLQEMADLEETTKENMSVRLSRLRDKIRRKLLQ